VSEPIRNFERTLRGSPDVPANVKLTGLRGVGKTVLLKEFERRATDDLGWIASRVQVEPRHNRDAELTSLIMHLAEQATQRASRAARLKAKVAGAAAGTRNLVKVSYEDIEFPLAGTDTSSTSIAEALFDAASAVTDNGHEGYLLLLDEVQVLRDERKPTGEHPLSLLIAAVNSLQEAGMPVGLVLCGLPTLKSNLLKARTYTERMFRGEEIGRLSGPSDATDAFVRPLDDTGITATDALAQRVVLEVEGYPFFIQLWGAELWDAAADAGLDVLDERLLEQVQPDIYIRLDNDFCGTRLESPTPAEQDLLMLTARCDYPPLRTSEIRRTSKRTGNNVNVLIGRLSDQGVVYRIQKGTYEYTAPKFHDYLKRRDAKLPS